MEEANFYEPLEFGWSETQYEADKALRQYIDDPFFSRELVELARQAAESAKRRQYEDVDEWARKLAASVAPLTD